MSIQQDNCNGAILIVGKRSLLAEPLLGTLLSPAAISASSPTSISCTFSNSSVTASQNNVAPGSAFTHVQLNQIGNAYLGAATCTATGGDAQIVGIVSQLGGQGDKLLYYEGFNTGN